MGTMEGWKSWGFEASVSQPRTEMFGERLPSWGGVHFALNTVISSEHEAMEEGHT